VLSSLKACGQVPKNSLSLKLQREGEREREHPEKVLKPAQILFFVIDQASTSFSPDFFIDIAMQR
jgi:hypothetical protein